MRVIDYFRQGLRLGAERIAFIDGDLHVTWGETNDRVERIAGAMASRGLGVGSRIAVYSPNDVMAFTSILAIFRLGAIWSPLNARSASEANRHFLNLMSCGCLVYHSHLEDEALALRPVLQAPALLVCIDREGPDGIPSLERFMAEFGDAAAPEPPDGNDVLASVFPTGGTTGLSKAVEWSLHTWETLISAFWQYLPSVEPPVHLVAGPMTHAAGVLALCSLSGGTTNVILKKPDPLMIMRAIEDHRVTHLYLPPTLIYAMLDHPEVRRHDYTSLHYMVVAASPIAPAKLREAMQVFGNVLCQSYGQAEAPMFMTFLPTRDLLRGSDEVWASCGRPTLATQVAIMAPDGALLPPLARGEIVARGNLVVPGYHRNEAATAAARAHGWHHTGDVGYVDAAGFVYIVDRLKDMVITGGFNVFSAEVEQEILAHPSVRDCAVVGVPDPKWGEAVKAIVELKVGAEQDAAGIIALVKSRLGSVHAPKSVEFWPELPRSAAGKILKREIRDGFWQGQTRAVG